MLEPKRAESALLQRNTANRVRQTASLVSGHDKIRERQGDHWAADMTSRTIYWRLQHPYKPDQVLNADQVLWLTMHEAAHLVLSGSFDVPEPPVVDDSKRFYRFWNACEDIRIERWLLTRYPGKAYTCMLMRQDFHDSLSDHYPDINDTGLHIADQVGLNWINIEYNLPVYGAQDAQDFTRKHWDAINEIVTTSRSSAEVAKRILPIYQELMEIMPPSSGEDDEGDIIMEVSMDGECFKSTDKDGNPAKILSFKEILEGMARDARGDTGRRLILKAKDEETAKKLAEMMAGHGIGTEASGIEGHSDDWERTKREQRGPINVLSRRLQTKLSHNTADHWETRLKRGQFNASHARRTLMGDMRVFRKKEAIGRADYDFVITVDMSGSQGGRERELLKSCVIASEAIEKSGMGVAIITWDSVMRHYKSFNSSLKATQGIIGFDLAHAGGGTYEGYALRVAEELMRPRLAMGRQVFLITMTDGQTNGVDESREMINDFKRRGVNAIGIGVMHPPPAHYDTQLEVNTGEELANVLPNLLKTIVKRG